jgi:hypothetical protein
VRTVKSAEAEGAVVGARCSPANHITQYWIEEPDGRRFWARFEELQEPVLMIQFSQQRWFFTSRAVICVVIFVCLLALSARAQNDSIAKRFVGAWKLVSVEREDPVFPLGYDTPRA